MVRLKEDIQAIDPTEELPSWPENSATASGEVVCDVYNIEIRVPNDGGNLFCDWIEIKYATIGSLEDVCEAVRLSGVPFWGHFY